MTDRFDTLLKERFQALANPVDDSDWEEVARRAGLMGRVSGPFRSRLAAGLRGHSRRRLVLALALLALVVVLLVAPAFGVGGKILSLFGSGEPAPTRVVKDFQSFDIGAPAGIGPDVRYRQARKVFERWVTPDLRAIIYAAPTATGGFCDAVEFKLRVGKTRQGWAGCVNPPHRPAFGITVGGLRAEDPRLITGSVHVPDAAALALAFQDGRRETQRLVWISEPINAAFFAFAVPVDRLQEGRRPLALIALDREGQEIARAEKSIQSNFSDDALRDCNNPTFSCDVVMAKKRKLIEITTEKGIKAAIWVAPSSKGGRCYWNTYGEKGGGFGGGCPPAGYEAPADALPGRSQGAGKGREVVLLWGQAGSAIASIDLTYQDGEHASVTPIEGLVLYEIPSRHWRPGHRLSLMIGRDENGRTVARQQVDTDTPGSYPCKTPKRIGTLVDGEGVFACP